MSNIFLAENVKIFLDNNDYCRLCLNKNTTLTSVFDKESHLNKFISNMYCIEIKQTDRLSQHICQECIDVCIDFLRRRFRYKNNNYLLKSIIEIHPPEVKRKLIKKETFKNEKPEDVQKKRHQSVIDICNKYKHIIIPTEYWNYDFNPHVICDFNHQGKSWPREIKIGKEKLNSSKNDINTKQNYPQSIKKKDEDEDFKKKNDTDVNIKNKDNQNFILGPESSMTNFLSLGVPSCIKPYQANQFGCSINHVKNDINNFDLVLPNNDTPPILDNEINYPCQSRTITSDTDITSENNRKRSNSESHVRSKEYKRRGRPFKIDKNFLSCSEDKWNSFFQQYYTCNEQESDETDQFLFTSSEPSTEKISKIRKRRVSYKDQMNYEFQELETFTDIYQPNTIKINKIRGRKKSCIGKMGKRSKSLNDLINNDSQKTYNQIRKQKRVLRSKNLEDQIEKSKKIILSKSINIEDEIEIPKRKYRKRSKNIDQIVKTKRKYMLKSKNKDLIIKSKQSVHKSQNAKSRLEKPKRKYVSRTEKKEDKKLVPKKMLYKRKKTQNTLKINKRIKISNKIELHNMPKENQIDVTSPTKINYNEEMSETYNYTSNNDYIVQKSEPVLSNLKMEPNENELLEQMSPPELLWEQMTPPELLLEQKAKKIFICSFCDKIFSNEKQLIIHQESHSNNYFPPCPQFKFECSEFV